jgi:hypothetical protein
MMKKVLLGIALLGCFVIAANAQPRAIGGRIGGDLEFSYQHQVGDNMIDATAGLWIGHGYLSVGAVAVYAWEFPINSWKRAGAWNWYVGPGVGMGVMVGNNIGSISASIGGQIGIEYQFRIPLNLSLDYRPMINALGFNNNTWAGIYGIALGVRYRFQ